MNNQLIQNSIFDALVPWIMEISYDDHVMVKGDGSQVYLPPPRIKFTIKVLIPYELKLDIEAIKKYFCSFKLETEKLHRFPTEDELRSAGIWRNPNKYFEGELIDSNIGFYLLSKMNNETESFNRKRNLLQHPG